MAAAESADGQELGARRRDARGDGSRANEAGVDRRSGVAKRGPRSGRPAEPRIPPDSPTKIVFEAPSRISSRRMLLLRNMTPLLSMSIGASTSWWQAK